MVTEETAPVSGPDVIKTEVPAVGYFVFERMSNELLEQRLWSDDIITATQYADMWCRNWPGVKFYVYSSITGKWYAYYKPIN